MIVYNSITRQEYHIDDNKIRKDGNSNLVCPACNDTRLHNGAKSFSFNKSLGTGNCKSCLITVSDKPKGKTYKRPTSKFGELTEETINWFEIKRGINRQTLEKLKITESTEFMPQENRKEFCVNFNYYKFGDLVNIKFRSVADKHFKMCTDAELCFYNLDSIKDAEIVYIVEGEIDCLSMVQAGFESCISVPNGGNKGNVNMEFFTNSLAFFNENQQYVICTDNDDVGINLRNQLAFRFGVEKCFIIEYPNNCKDFNEVLCFYNKEKIAEIIENKKYYPIDGIFTANDKKNEILNIYKYGLKKGYLIGNGYDEFISFETKRLYIITGIPSDGKSTVLDNWLISLNQKFGLKTALFTPENYPIEVYSHIFLSKLLGFYPNPSNIDEETLSNYLDVLSDNYYYIDPPEDYSLDTILKMARIAVFQKGVKCLVIDPYNKIEHQMERGESETNYISRMLDRLSNFAKRNDVIVFLIAHPTKMKKGADGLFELPNLYSINGSANFYNKCDFGITVFRNRSTKQTEVHIQKCKFQHLGKEGTNYLNYINGTYQTLHPESEFDYGNGYDPDTRIESNTKFEEVDTIPF